MYAPNLGASQPIGIPGGGITFLPDLQTLNPAVGTGDFKAVPSLATMNVQGRGDWLVPVAIGILAAYFIFYRGGRRRDW